MNDDGFTLPDALAALFMVGLAVAGLAEGVRVLGAMQQRAAGDVARNVSARAVERDLVSLLRGQGPFTAKGGGGFAGDAGSFSFDCAAGIQCGAQLLGNPSAPLLRVTGPGGAAGFHRLAGETHPRFAYADERGELQAWPPRSDGQDRVGSRRSLRTVSLVGDQGTTAPFATVRVWREQALSCRFDAISGDCRPPAP